MRDDDGNPTSTSSFFCVPYLGTFSVSSMLVAHSHYVQGGSFPLSRHPRGTAAPHSAAHRLFRSSLSRSARPKPSPHMRAASRRPDRWITLKADQARAPINRDAGWHGVGSTAAARTPQCTAISWVGGSRGKGWQRSAWIPGPSTPNADAFAICATGVAHIES